MIGHKIASRKRRSFFDVSRQPYFCGSIPARPHPCRRKHDQGKLARALRELTRGPKFRRIVLSCDPAGKANAHNDFTAVTVCGVDGKSIHVLHATRGHWTVMQMKDRIISLAAQWKADLILVEDTSSGMGLIQLLREQPRLNVVGRHPRADKETRMARHQGRFEAGRVLLPKEAPWLAELESELLAFPNGRYDDQVDALFLYCSSSTGTRKTNPTSTQSSLLRSSSREPI